MSTSHNTNIYNTVIGDYDNDGQVTATDADLVLEAYTELGVNEVPIYDTTSHYSEAKQQITCGDVDGDGDISSADAQFVLLKYTEVLVSGNDTTFDDLMGSATYRNYTVEDGYFNKDFTNLATYGFYENSDFSGSKIEAHSTWYYIDKTNPDNQKLYYCDGTYYPRVSKLGEIGSKGYYKENPITGAPEFYSDAERQHIIIPTEGYYYLSLGATNLYMTWQYINGRYILKYTE